MTQYNLKLNYAARLIGALAIFTSLSGAAAADPENNANILEIINTGQMNILSIAQSPGAGHSARVTISGRGNGAPTEEFSATPRWFLPIAPGTIEQTGESQFASLEVSGLGNLFAIRQSGGSNHVSGAISGIANQAAVIQAGFNNRAVFTQQGTNNFVAINQSM
ncbi:hypothetical protein [Oceaniglobus trochenteri]|uniref:hypothetical protein n=1 Tax=Oceaniglobus trochenteri TaxID=2763260 RepID=UPI001CFF90C5|nr:hypothetical protein [Oceaniglobus trochenteri]